MLIAIWIIVMIPTVWCGFTMYRDALRGTK
jgi:hypothetical protein